jgi:hypothetical protein
MDDPARGCKKESQMKTRGNKFDFEREEKGRIRDFQNGIVWTKQQQFHAI